MYVCVLQGCSDLPGQKRLSDPLGLEVEAMSYHVEVGK